MTGASLIPPRPAPARPRPGFSWRSRATRGLLYQIFAVALVALLASFLLGNTLENMRQRGIQSGFDFLTQPAGFDIGEGWLLYASTDPYWKAFLVGLVNTVRVAAAGALLATMLGVLLGVGRFSRNALIRGLSYGYVELLRNIPVLLQLLMWYLLLSEYLPEAGEPLTLAKSIFLSKNGVVYPLLVWRTGHSLAVGGLIAAMAFIVVYARAGRARFERTGRPSRVWPIALALIVVLPFAGWLAGGAPAEWETPKMGEFQVEGGGALSPEYLAVQLGLVLYTAAFIAEVVRAGIASVSQGQLEASASLGLSRARTMRLVILPQALRLIVPPLTNQYLNLTKNSSLAVAVGYPELVSIANTSINQTGRAVECISIIMLVYLSTSLATSALMNWFNKRAALKER
jgi:general L-amino acid transport system permease protein